MLNWKLPDDRDISNIKIKWIQDMSDNSSMKEILLDGNVTKYEFSVDEENKQCMLRIYSSITSLLALNYIKINI